jgi:D-alanyl-D-alanine carboxypeptidase
MKHLHQLLQAEIERSLALDPSLPGIMATVEIPKHCFAWSGACGLARRGSPAALTPEHAFRIASVTKVYTAATVMRLIEQGRLTLFEPIEARLLPASAAALRSAGHAPERITLFHLLTHTSGLVDHAASENYMQAIQAAPQRRWTRAAQIDFAMQLGGPVAELGREFSYSDTGFILLGEIIEGVSGQPLPAVIREQLGFKRLGLKQTHFETLEAEPPGQVRAHQYIGDWDGLEVDASCDLYGGGGLISTTQEIATFLRALLRGELFDQAQTLAMALMTPSVRFKPGDFLHSALLRGRCWGSESCWGHGGFWGIGAAYFPAHDAALVTAYNQVECNAHTAGSPEQAGLMGRLAVILHNALR